MYIARIVTISSPYDIVESFRFRSNSWCGSALSFVDPLLKIMNSKFEIMFDKVAKYLSKSSINSDDYYPHYIGCLVILYDLFDFIPVILIDILLFHSIFNSFFFIVFLSILRQHTGGIHAPNATLCSMFYSLLFITFCHLTQISLTIQVEVIITLLCDLFSLINACNATSKSAFLSKSIYNRNMSFIVLITYSLAEIICFFKYDLLSRYFFWVIAINTVLIAVSAFQGMVSKRRAYENSNSRWWPSFFDGN